MPWAWEVGVDAAAEGDGADEDEELCEPVADGDGLGDPLDELELVLGLGLGEPGGLNELEFEGWGDAELQPVTEGDELTAGLPEVPLTKVLPPPVGLAEVDRPVPTEPPVWKCP